MGWKFNRDYIEIYNQNCNERHFLEFDVQYPVKLHDLYYDLPFLSKRMKTQKVGKLIINLQDKEGICYTHKKFKTSIK